MQTQKLNKDVKKNFIELHNEKEIIAVLNQLLGKKVSIRERFLTLSGEVKEVCNSKYEIDGFLNLFLDNGHFAIPISRIKEFKLKSFDTQFDYDYITFYIDNNSSFTYLTMTITGGIKYEN